MKIIHCLVTNTVNADDLFLVMENVDMVIKNVGVIIILWLILSRFIN